MYGKLSVVENLRLFARLAHVDEVDAAVARMLEQIGLQERQHERVERLSGGNRQRVNVALGLISDPPALALDEPTSALDPGQRERLWEFVAALARAGRAVVFSTHHLGEVKRHASRAIVLADGELLFDGPPGELVAAAGGEADFEAAFVSFLRSRGHSGPVPVGPHTSCRRWPSRSCVLGARLGATKPSRLRPCSARPSIARGARAYRIGPEVRWLFAKDILILRRSRLLVGVLVIYPIAIALLIGLAISRSPGEAEGGDRRRNPRRTDGAGRQRNGCR